jgi:hypothetical protein
MIADPIRQQVVDLYHRRYKTAHFTAKATGLTVEEVLELAGEQPQPTWPPPKPLPTCIRRGCGRKCSRVGARYCSRGCALEALVERQRAGGAAQGCGCTDRTLCQSHGERLERARGRG